MRRRIIFVGRALMSGVRWLYGVIGAVGNFFLVVALVAGVSVSVTLLDAPTWVIAFVLLVLFFAVFAEGAYRQWNEADATARVVPNAQTYPAHLTR